MHQLNWMGIHAFICSGIVASAAFYILGIDPLDKSHRAFFYFCLSLLGWILGDAFIYCSKNSTDALFYSRFSFIGVSFISITNLYFNTTLFNIKLNKFFWLGQLTLSFVWMYLASSPLIYKAVNTYFWGYYPIVGAAHPFFLIYFSATWIYGFYILARQMQIKKAQGEFEAYNQIKFIFMAWLGAIVGAVDFFPNYGINIFPFGINVAVYWVGLCALFLTKKHTRDKMNFFIRKILITCYIAAVLSVVYAIEKFFNITKIFNPSQIELLAIGGGSILMLQLLYHGIRKFIDKLFFPEYYTRNKNFMQLGLEIAANADKEQFRLSLLKNIYTLFGTMKSSLFMASNEDGIFLKVSTCECGFAYPTTGTAQPICNASLAQHLAKHSIIDFNHLYQQRGISTTDVKRLMLWMLLHTEGNLIIPISVNDKLKAFIILGEKESGLPYSQKDKNDLLQIADLAAISLKSDHFYNYQIELKKMIEQKTLALKKIQDALLQKEKLAAIGTLAGEISHELRNPLKSFEINTAILEKKLRDNMDIALLAKTDALKQDIQTMRRSISNMLDYCRTRPLMLQPCHINQLLYECLNMIEKPNHIKVKLQFDPTIKSCLIDTHEMRQAFTNILINACQAMTDPGELSIHTKMLHKEFLEICIADTGCGIESEYLDKIFEPFSSTKTNGNGLGMAVVKKVILRHQGNIIVKSQLGQGSLFIISLPMRYAKKTEEHQHELVQQKQKNTNI